MKIYVVTGSSGTCPDDREEWTVCAYREEEDAKVLVDELASFYEELEKGWRENRRPGVLIGDYAKLGGAEIAKKIRVLDPDGRWNEFGSFWVYEPVELVEVE